MAAVDDPFSSCLVREQAVDASFALAEEHSFPMLGLADFEELAQREREVEFCQLADRDQVALEAGDKIHIRRRDRVDHVAVWVVVVGHDRVDAHVADRARRVARSICNAYD